MEEKPTYEVTVHALAVCEDGHAQVIPGTARKALATPCDACKKLMLVGDKYCPWCGRKAAP